MRAARASGTSHRGTHAAGAAALAVRDTVVRQYARAALAEDAQVVVELHGEVAPDDAVPRVLRVTRAGGACERGVLVEDVVYADHYLAELVAEHLFAYVGIAERIRVVVVVRVAYVLYVRSRGREGKALPEYGIQRTRGAVVEIFVAAAAPGLDDNVAANGIPALK